MAHLELSKKEAQLLVEALQMVEICWMDSGRDHDPLLAIRERADSLKFNTRACIVCGTKFEATNPRKQTCSDACRQALSRSKRAKPIFSVGDLVQPRKGKSHSFTVTKIRWNGGYYFVTGADGTGCRESDLKRAKTSHTTTVTRQETVAPSQPDRDS
jgi:hypothetical protein